jgi:hypothetical protein
MILLLILLVPLGITIFLIYNGRSCSKGCHGCGKCMNNSRTMEEDPPGKEQK